MKEYLRLFCLTVLAGCASAPQKKRLDENDYLVWQKDLTERVQREESDATLRRRLYEVALINGDFPTALQQLRILRDKLPAEMIALSLQEISILRDMWRLDEALKRLDAFVATYPKAPETPMLVRRRGVIEKSKALPPPLKVSPYARQPFADYRFVQAMQAPEIAYAESFENGFFVAAKSGLPLEPAVWPGSKTALPQFGKQREEELDLAHYPETAQGGGFEPPGYLHRRANTIFEIHADGRREDMDFLAARGCTLPGYSPWRDFLIASCRNGSHFDLILFRPDGKGWREEAINAAINTGFDELAPRISADGRFLFFASDGHPGYGAHDYFYAPIEYRPEGPVFGAPVNFGPRVNTYHNEVYPLYVPAAPGRLTFSAEGKNGLTGTASEGLPRVKETLSCRFVAYAAQGATPAKITLTPLKGDNRVPLTLVSGAKADWIRLIHGAEYLVSFGAQEFRIQAVPTAGKNFIIERFSTETVPGAVQLHYSAGASGITKDIRPELEKTARLLQENKKLHALIEGHTDNIGGAAYNQKLSERRAAAAKKLLHEMGVAADQITARGWGESRPLNANASTEERQANRRIEILLVPE